MRLMALLSMLALAGGLVSAEEREQEVAVCIENDFDAAIQRTQAMTSRMFATIGVRIEWLRGQRSCIAAPDSIVIILNTATPRDYHPGALAFALPNEGKHIRVFYDRVRKSVGPLTLPALLAHVFAHEIAHLLQGVSRHSTTGVMKEHWDTQDYNQIAFRGLSFTDQDVRLIHLGLETRPFRVAAQAARQ